jgi:hypothetical protein
LWKRRRDQGKLPAGLHKKQEKGPVSAAEEMSGQNRRGGKGWNDSTGGTGEAMVNGDIIGACKN